MVGVLGAPQEASPPVTFSDLSAQHLRGAEDGSMNVALAAEDRLYASLRINLRCLLGRCGQMSDRVGAQARSSGGLPLAALL